MRRASNDKAAEFAAARPRPHRRECQGDTKTGLPCTRNPLPGSAYCERHHPARSVAEFRTGGSVYFVEAADGPIKIGWTSRDAITQARLEALQVGNPWPLRVLGSTPGSVAFERELHTRFADRRMSGEWFSPTPELLALIDELTAPLANPPKPVK